MIAKLIFFWLRYEYGSKRWHKRSINESTGLSPSTFSNKICMAVLSLSRGISLLNCEISGGIKLPERSFYFDAKFCTNDNAFCAIDASGSATSFTIRYKWSRTRSISPRTRWEHTWIAAARTRRSSSLRSFKKPVFAEERKGANKLGWTQAKSPSATIILVLITHDYLLSATIEKIRCKC